MAGTLSVRGATLVEALAALLLGLAVVHFGLRTLTDLRAAHRRLEARHEVLVSRRIVRSALRGEIAAAKPGDWTVAGDSLVVRAFRGRGVVCSSLDGGASLTVVYEGDREPDPAKDSVEVLHADGSVTHVALSSVQVTDAGCAADGRFGRVSVWRVEPPTDARPVLVRPFELGAYGLSTGALRYRLAGGGRQPLTADAFEVGVSGVRARGRSAGIELAPAMARSGGPWAGFLGWLEP